jgi:hypothetical protein
MPRHLIEEKQYTEQLNALRVNWKRFDDAFMTLEPAIRLVPDIFPQVPGTLLRRVRLVGFEGVPPLSIYFAVKGDTAHLVAAELIPDEDGW